jgi:hypothetical protein
MAVTKLDISLAARAAGHLYQTTAYLGTLILGALTAAAQPRFLHTQLGTCLVILFLGIGFLSALYYARRELNGWAYVIATVCTVLLVAIAGGLEFELATPENFAPENIETVALGLSFIFLIIIYLVRVLIDYSRLALSGHNASSKPPLRLANEVSKLLRRRPSLVPWVHMPTNPGRTFVYAILFLLSLSIDQLPRRVWLQYVPSESREDFVDFLSSLRLITFVVVAAMGALARRHYVLRADRVLELDNRRPILFLRSFADDKVRLWGKGIFGKFRRKTIDEAIERLAKRLGPFVAIANPNTQLPQLGAAQTYFSNDTWQNAIARWVQTAQMIVMVAGRN